MGKASRSKRAGTARERIAVQRAAARRAEIRNRVLLASGAVVVVIAIVVAFVLVKINAKTPATTGNAVAPTGAVLPASVVHDITTVPAGTLNAVGAGTSYPRSIIKIPGAHLISAGKPEVLYFGAEYCPYCATERWAMAVALSRFGTFSALHGIHSSTKPTEPFPGTRTLTFYKSTYTSKYITFTPVETETVSENVLQKPTSAQAALVAKYDAPPYQQDSGSIPFVDFGNQYMISGASYDPAVLSGKTWAQIAAALDNPSTAIAKGADGTANLITAAICKLTNNQPVSACTPVVKALEAKL